MTIRLTILNAVLAAPLLGAATNAPTAAPAPLVVTPAVDDHLREMEEVLHGLRAGHEALRHLGLREEADHMEAIIDRVRDDFERRQVELERSRHDRERQERNGDQDDERRRHQLRRDLEVARIGLHGLREAEKRDLADMLERAMHAQELKLAGHDGPDARHAIESAPSDGQVSEILQVSSRLWAEFGNRENANLVNELAERIAREGRERHPREDEAHGRGPRDPRGHGDDVHARLERLEAHIHELTEVLQEMRRAMDENRQREREPRRGGRIRIF